MRTGFISLRLAKALYIIPFLFVYTPMLMISGTWPEIIATWISCALGLVCSTAVLELYLFRRTKWYEAILLGVTAVILFVPSYSFDLLGLGIFGLVAFMQRDAWRVPALARRLVEGQADPPEPPH